MDDASRPSSSSQSSHLNLAESRRDENRRTEEEDRLLTRGGTIAKLMRANAPSSYWAPDYCRAIYTPPEILRLLRDNLGFSRVEAQNLLSAWGEETVLGAAFKTLSQIEERGIGDRGKQIMRPKGFFISTLQREKGFSRAVRIDYCVGEWEDALERLELSGDASLIRVAQHIRTELGDVPNVTKIRRRAPPRAFRGRGDGMSAGAPRAFADGDKCERAADVEGVRGRSVAG